MKVNGLLKYMDWYIKRDRVCVTKAKMCSSEPKIRDTNEKKISLNNEDKH